jgi:hypothetical protein
MVVESRLNPVWFNGGNIPSIAGIERRSQFFLSDGVRTGIWTLVAEAQHIQGSIVLGHPGQARHVSWSLFAIKGVEQSAIQHCLETAPQALQMERVSRDELDVNRRSHGRGLLSGDRQCRLSYVNAQNRQSQPGDVKSVLAGPAARIEDRSGESAFGCYTHNCRLRLANIPGRRALVIRRIPGLSRHPFVAGWLPATEEIVSASSRLIGHLPGPFLQVIMPLWCGGWPRFRPPLAKRGECELRSRTIQKNGLTISSACFTKSVSSNFASF